MFFLQYKVAGASQHLAITGYKIKDVKLAKKAWILPGQKCSTFDVSPVNYTFEVQAMSVEKLPFLLPAVFTIGPRIDVEESLRKYAMLLSSHDKLSTHVRELVQGVIEGETRVLAATMRIEEIFRGANPFKQAVIRTVQLELNQFGLIIYNSNVKQLVDVRGHEYFSYLGQKTHHKAVNQAKADVAEAKMKGDIAAKKRDGKTRRYAAKIDAETKVYATKRAGARKKEEIKVNTDVSIFENAKKAEVAEADADLAMKKAGWSKQAQVAEVEASKAIAIREAELQTEVEKRNAITQTEKFKSQLLSKAKVDYKMKVQEANSELYKKKKQAEADLYENEKAAEGRKAVAEAAFFAKQKEAEAELDAKKKEAEAELYAKKKEAEGLLESAQAQGTYLSTLFASVGQDYKALRDYLMIDRRTYQEIAKFNSEAIQGLKPKISVWTNGVVEANQGGGALKEMAEVYKMLVKIVEKQMQMVPPPWMGTMRDDQIPSSSD